MDQLEPAVVRRRAVPAEDIDTVSVKSAVRYREPRILIWFWGTSGAGIRLVDRLATVISGRFPAENVAIFGHANNELLQQSRERGHPVTVLSGAAGHRKVGALVRQALPRAVLFWDILRRQRPDALIIPMNFALAWPLVLFTVLLRIPYAYMVHDTSPHPGDFAPLWQTTTQRRLIARARCIIAPSAFTADQVRSRLSPKAPIEILPLATLIPPTFARPRVLPAGPIRFLFLGRLLPYKGLTLLADALRPLIARDDWRLTVAGTGPEGDAVRQSFSNFRQVDLSQIRSLPEEAIDTLIATHDVLICPYTEASQSGVIAEAYAQSMPCIVTPVGALPEQVDGGRLGWIAAGICPEDLRGAIETVLDQPWQITEKSRVAADALSRVSRPKALDAIVGHLLR